MNIAGIREFECSSFTEFVAWKEEEEEKNNVYYAQTTGRKALNDSTNIGEIGTMAEFRLIISQAIVLILLLFTHTCRVQVPLLML